MSRVISPTEEQVLRFGLTKRLKESFRPEPGEYEGRGTANFFYEYQLKVGEDYESVISPAVPWEKLATLLASKVNKKTLATVLEEALEGGENGAIKESVKGMVHSLKESTKRQCSGKVGGHVTIAVIR